MAKKAVKKYFSFIILVITILLMIFTFVGLWGGSVNPAGNTARAMLCFALPLIIICNVFLLIFWIIMRRLHWAIIPAIAILSSINYIGTLFQARSLPSDVETQQGIKIATYNVGRFGKEASGFIAQDILMEMINQKVDIICFQEYSDFAEETKNQDKFKKYFPYMAMGKNDMVIFSKYKITSKKIIAFDESNNSALWADVDINGNIVRIFNVHMETTGFNSTLHSAGKMIMQGQQVEDNKILKAIYGNYMVGMIVRAGQATLIANEKRASSKRIILCGDFNDVPYSYVYNTLKGDLEDGFKECGSGWMWTFRGKKKVRIDYILHDKNMKGIAYYTKKLTYSDHIPVFLKIKL
jgi:endonuclease/exonuclease/phosphatase family metal-dependent hydrolase